MAVLRLFAAIVPWSRSCLHRFAEDTTLLKEVLQFALSIKDEVDVSESEAFFMCLLLISNAVRTTRADLKALRSTKLYELVEHAMADSKSKEQIVFAARILFFTFAIDPEHKFLSEYPSIWSSLLALANCGPDIEGIRRQAFLMVLHCLEQVKDFEYNPEAPAVDVVYSLFKADEAAVRRAVQLRRMFTAPSEDVSHFRYLEKPRKKQTTGAPGETVADDKGYPGFSNVSLKPRLERRKCSEASCCDVEAEGGTFQVCGKCRIAVYCSKGEGQNGSAQACF